MNVCFVDLVFFPMMIRMAHDETTLNAPHTHTHTRTYLDLSNFAHRVPSQPIQFNNALFYPQAIARISG